MPSLWNLITCARQSGQWTRSWLASVRSMSSDVIRRADHLDPCRLPAPVPIPAPRPRHFGRALLPVLALAILPVAAVQAAQRGIVSTIDGNLVDVQVLVEGRTAPLYVPTDGADRRYFQAFRGKKYALSLTNNTGRRIGVLIAVDGLNVVSGQRSRLASTEPMYVLDPWERTTIRGWRSSLQDVRQFVFVDEQRSYAERTGQANGDLGWVRVQAFNERGRWFDYGQGRVREGERDRLNEEPYGALDKDGARAPEASRDEAGAAPQLEGRDDGARRQKAAEPNTAYKNDVPPPSAEAVPGTGWGDRRHDPVRQVRFDPERYASDRIVLRYEYASGLRALGIDPRGSRNRLWERERGELGFAQPPSW